MPKKFTLTDKKKWLELYDQGKSEKYIAREHAHCDVRTVQRGLEVARHAQDVRAAQMEVLKDAIKNHQDDLLGVVHDLIKAMVPPQPELYIQWQRDDAPQTFSFAGATVEYKGKGEWESFLNVEQEPIWEFFWDHLRKYQTLREVANWRRDIVNHLKARVELQRRLVAMLEAETGLAMDSQGMQSIESIATHELYRIAIRKVLGFSVGKYSEADIKVGDTGEVMLGGHLLAKVAKGKEEKCKNSIIISLNKLLESDEAAAVRSTHTALLNTMERFKKTLHKISMTHYISGTCEICNNIGL
jgi:hypothetical protein